MIGGGFGELVEMFGALRGIEVLGTAPYPFARTWVRTFGRLTFEQATVVVTYGYRKGEFFDFST